MNPVGMGILIEPKSPKSVFPESRRDDISRQRVASATGISAEWLLPHARIGRRVAVISPVGKCIFHRGQH